MNNDEQLIKELFNFNTKNAKKFIFQDVITLAKVLKVYDGDTITILFKYNNEYLRISCRIMGIDTPELRGSCDKEKELGYIARDYLSNLILNKIIKIHILDEGKYGRPIINIFLLDQEETNINKLMISGGYAKPYYGGAKSPWV
jgi:micrococcal nuclease